MRFVFELYSSYKNRSRRSFSPSNSHTLNLSTRYISSFPLSLSLSLSHLIHLLIMKRNCNLELRLVTPSVYFHLADRNHSMLDLEDESPNKTQQLTIFYNGKMASCDATELQARAIISLASREMEGKSSKDSPCSPPPAAAMNSPVYSAATGLSMKRSLQRFLEKRKSRAQSISPYPITRQ